MVTAVRETWNRHVGTAAPAFGSVLVVLVFATTLWTVSGVGLRDVALFVGYEVLYVLGPGWVAYVLLRPRSSTFERLAFGWGLGYALEIGAFALTATLHARGLLVAYPLVPALLALFLRRHLAGDRAVVPNLFDAWSISAITCVVGVALVLASAALYPAHPLPGTVGAVDYTEDMLYHLSLAGEALHHWPITNPPISGERLPYHTFVHMHMAAVAQVTGIDLPVVVFRLVLLPMTIVFVLQTALASARLGGRRWIGPVGAALLLLVSELDLDPHRWIPFLGTFFAGVYLSPSFLLGLLFFVPIVVLLVDLVVEAERPARWCDWVLLALFTAGAVGAKVTIEPVVIGGLVLFLLARRQRIRRGVSALILSCTIFGAIWLLMYRGGNGGIQLRFPAATGDGVQLLESELTWLPQPLVTGVGMIVGFVALFGAPLCGLLWFTKAPRKRLTLSDWFLLSLFAVSLGPYFLFRVPGLSQLFFTEYGFAAAAFLSATGLYRIWTISPPSEARDVRRIWLFAVIWAAALVIEIKVVDIVTSSEKVKYLLWYGLTGAVLLWLALAALRAAPTRRGLPLRLLLVAVLTAATLNIPLDLGPRLLQAARHERPAYQTGPGLTRGLYAGLEWLRDRTSPNSVIAVSNYSNDPSDPNPDDLNYSAFAERRTFLEGWRSGVKTLNLGVGVSIVGRQMPYPERRRLNNTVFQKGDRRALRVLVRDYGVRYLVVDRIHGGRIAAVAQLGELVFSNADVAIVAIAPAPYTGPGRSAESSVRLVRLSRPVAR